MAWIPHTIPSRSLLQLLPRAMHGTTTTPLHATIPSEGASEDAASHSYVEGEVFADREAEIEAMGGDPFFLMDDDDDNEQEEDSLSNSNSQEDDNGNAIPSTLLSSMAMMSGSSGGGGGGGGGGGASAILQKNQRFATDGMGPTPKEETQQDQEDDDDDDDWEWDGTVDETAYFDD